LWGWILAGVPGSRLVLKSSALSFPERLIVCWTPSSTPGSIPRRVHLRGWIGERRHHLDAYGDIDIALDTFPYHGTTTTCERCGWACR